MSSEIQLIAKKFSIFSPKIFEFIAQKFLSSIDEQPLSYFAQKWQKFAYILQKNFATLKIKDIVQGTQELYQIKILLNIVSI